MSLSILKIDRISNAVPEVSVVIPLYQRAHLIEATIRSVLAQTFQDFEIVIVDDGSTDNPGAVIERIDDPRIRFLSFSNAGVGTARNRGIDAARGRFVALLDSDDHFLPHHLKMMHDLVSHQPQAIAYSQVVVHRGDGVHGLKPPHAKKDGETMAEYLMCGSGFVQSSSIFMAVEIASQVRYRADTSFGDDTDFAIRLDVAGHKFIMADQPGVLWSDLPNPGRLSAPERLRSSIADQSMAWLEDLRPIIPERAYLAYLGWHVAKGTVGQHPLLALRLYVKALLHGAYDVRRALIVASQIFMPEPFYRRAADNWIRTRSMYRRISGHVAVQGGSSASART